MNADRYQKDLDALIVKGSQLYLSMARECSPQDFERQIKEEFGETEREPIKNLPSYKTEYQVWYSEAKTLVRHLLPEILADFTRYYEKPKTRKEITYENYTIEDYLQGVN